MFVVEGREHAAKLLGALLVRGNRCHSKHLAKLAMWEAFQCTNNGCKTKCAHVQNCLTVPAGAISPTLHFQQIDRLRIAASSSRQDGASARDNDNRPRAPAETAVK